jgi:hypothetical protein
MEQMYELMDDHVVESFDRPDHEPPVEGKSSGGGA